MISRIAAGLSATAFAIFTSGTVAQPNNATHIPTEEIMTVFQNLGETIDQQIRVVDIGDDINVAVGILRRAGARTEGEEVTAIVHHRVTEVYYVLEGSGILVTGGDESNELEFPADNS